jgi:hypothetical protein
MAIENEVAKTPREHFTRDADDELPKFKERTLQRSALAVRLGALMPSHERNFSRRLRFGAI